MLPLPAARAALAAALMLSLASRPLQAQTAPLAPEIEEAATVARRVASGAAMGRGQPLESALDRPALLGRAVPKNILGKLTPLQREKIEKHLLAVIRDTIVLAEPPRTHPDIITTEIRTSADSVSIGFLLSYGTQRFKTRWDLARRGAEWKIEDIHLTDLGVSLADRAVADLGPRPIRKRDSAREARQAFIPRALGILGALVVGAVFGRRLSRAQRLTLWLAAAVPVLLFTVDGFFAVRRVLTEPYELSFPSDRNNAEMWIARAASASSRGDFQEAQRAWRLAIRAGAAPEPIEYRLGVLAQTRHDSEQAVGHFRRALSGRRPAPGAHAGLALEAMRAGRFEQARAEWEAYIAATGPDPDALSSLASCLVALGRDQDAEDVIGRALARWPGDPTVLATGARVEAYRGDAPRAVWDLRSLLKLQPLDARALEEDPAFSNLAESPEWTAFLEELRKAAPVPGSR